MKSYFDNNDAIYDTDKKKKLDQNKKVFRLILVLLTRYFYFGSNLFIHNVHVRT